MTADVQGCTGPDWTAGLSLLEAMARTGRRFTANDIRPQLVELGFGRFTTGSLFQQSEDDGAIRQVGVRRSTGKSAHGAFVREWIGTAHHTVAHPRAEVVVPIQRSSDGRFAATPLFTDVPLPMELGT